MRSGGKIPKGILPGGTGNGFAITRTDAVDDGLLDASMLDRTNLETLSAATSRSGPMVIIWVARLSR